MRTRRPQKPREREVPPDAPEAVAHHEAGHVGAALWLGMTVVEASIVPNAEGNRGHCHIRTAGKGAEAVLVFKYAGAAAEHRWRFLGEPPALGTVRPGRWGWRSDYRSARRLAVLHTEAGCSPDLLDAARKRAELLVSIPSLWSAIRLLARALLRDGALDGERARRIYTAAIEAARKG